MACLWTYMGLEENPPELPSLEWNMVPEDHVILSMRIAENNFMQPIEGEYDSTHIGFLHQGAFRREDNQSKIPGFLDSVLRPKRGYPYP